MQTFRVVGCSGVSEMWAKNENGVWIAKVDYGLVDQKNRRVGAILYIRQEKDGHFEGRVQSARDGRSFGAWNTKTHGFLSLNIAQLELLDRADIAARGARRKALKTEGV